MPRRPAVQLSTTSDLQGWSIERYLGPVTAHTVVGTGLFLDILAGFSDILGGRSHTYQKRLHQMSNDVFLAIREEAAERGANWVVGLTVDMDEISGKGMQMFMTTAMGTAVIARPKADFRIAPAPINAGQIRSEDLTEARKRYALLDQIEKGKLEFTDETWGVLIGHRMASALPAIVAGLIQFGSGTTEQSVAFRNKVLEFVEVIDVAEAQTILHRMVAFGDEPNSRAAITIIAKTRLLDLGTLKRMFETSDREQRIRLLQLLDSGQRVYTLEDCDHLRAIASLCTDENFPGVANVVQGAGGAFGSAPRILCECGTARSIHDRFCPRRTCLRDAHGFRSGEVTHEKARQVCTEFAAVLERALREAATINGIDTPAQESAAGATPAVASVSAPASQ